MTVFFYLAIALFMIICVVLCFVVLVQESKSLGLGASFGGDAGESLFGTSTADVLKKFTAWVGVIFVISCIMLSLWSSHIGRNKYHVEPPSIEQTQ